MKQDYESCEFCGCVVDIEKLKLHPLTENDEEKGVSIGEKSEGMYADYYDFIKWKCPACKKSNQR